MKKTMRYMMVVLVCLLLVACAGSKKAVKPDWVWNPNPAGKIGGIGISGPHINGVNAQRELAITRALDEIARQLGVTVKNISKIKSVGNRDHVDTCRESYSIQTVSGQRVTASIMKFWKDPDSDELYVWMVVK